MMINRDNIDLKWVVWLIIDCVARGLVSKAKAAGSLGISLADFMIEYDEEIKELEETYYNNTHNCSEDNI